MAVEVKASPPCLSATAVAITKAGLGEVKATTASSFFSCNRVEKWAGLQWTPNVDYYYCFCFSVSLKVPVA